MGRANLALANFAAANLPRHPVPEVFHADITAPYAMEQYRFEWTYVIPAEDEEVNVGVFNLGGAARWVPVQAIRYRCHLDIDDDPGFPLPDSYITPWRDGGHESTVDHAITTVGEYHVRIYTEAEDGAETTLYTYSFEILHVLYFMDDPSVNTQGPLATHVTVESPTHDALVSHAEIWAVGAAVTFDHTDNLVTSAGHGLSDGDIIMLGTDAALPAELDSYTLYYVRDAAANTLRVALTDGGVAVAFTDDGTGPHAFHPVDHERVVERVMDIDSGDADVCRAVAEALIDRWGHEQASVSGKVTMAVTIRFDRKVRVIIPEAGLNADMIPQRKEHDIVDQSTTVTVGDIILGDAELLARILDDLD